MKLNLPGCRKAFNTRLRPLLADLGFAAKGLSCFMRSNPLGTEILRFPDRREPDRCLFCGNLGLSIQAVEKILRPESDEPFPTIWMPFHFLHDDRRLLEWAMSSEDDALGVASAVMEEIHAYVLPFFAEHSTVEAIKRSLESTSPRDGFALVPQQTACVLAALEYLAADVDRAFEILENAISAERGKVFPKDRDVKELLAALRNREAAHGA